jgi:hypothetical protein
VRSHGRAEMADAAAEHIAARAGADIEPQRFVPVLRGKLLTGGAPRRMRRADDTSEVADHILWWPPRRAPRSPDRLMFEVRIHGCGGQGVVIAAEMLSLAAFIEHRHRLAARSDPSANPQ